MLLNSEEIEAMGLDEKQIRSIARRVEKAMSEADKLGVYLFGGGGGPQLRFDDEYRDERGPVVIGTLGGFRAEGGDGSAGPCIEDGLERGEF